MVIAADSDEELIRDLNDQVVDLHKRAEAAEAEVERLRKALTEMVDRFESADDDPPYVVRARAVLRGERESREGCRSANCEKAGASWDHPHPAHPSLGALYGKGGEDETERLRAEVERLEGLILVWRYAPAGEPGIAAYENLTTEAERIRAQREEG